MVNKSEVPFDFDEFDIEIDKSLLGGLSLDDLDLISNVKKRKLFLTDDVDSYNAVFISKMIMSYNKEDADKPVEEREPIRIYIASNGGSVDAGMGIVDAIMCSKTPVHTINMAYEYSMAFIIGMFGHKRYSMPNAKFLLHDGTNFVYDSGSKAQDTMEFNKRVEEKMKNYILSRTHIPEEEYNKNLRKEWYMFSEDAKEYGVIDYIIGKDCSIDEVI